MPSNIDGFSEKTNHYKTDQFTKKSPTITALGKTTIRQDLGDVKIAFKIIGIWIAAQFYRLTGNLEQKNILQHRVRHLERNVDAHEHQNTYSKNLVVSARNMMKLYPFNSKNFQMASEKYVKQATSFLKHIGLNPIGNNDNQQSFVLQLAKIRKEVRAGVCAGACIEFARKIINNLSIANILGVAENFKSGAPVAAVISQFASAKIDINNATEIYKGLNNKRAEIAPFKKKMMDVFKQCVALNVDLFATKKEYYSLFMSQLFQLKKNNKLDSKEVHFLIDKHTEEYPQHGHIFSEIGLGSLKLYSSGRVTNQSKDFSTDNTVGRYDAIANARGLKFGKDRMNQKTDDPQNLKIISTLADGVYELSLDTSPDTSHATLVIRSEGVTFFWDPNIGLLQCDEKNPDQTILKVLKTYPKIKGLGKNNHNLRLKELRSIS